MNIFRKLISATVLAGALVFSGAIMANPAATAISATPLVAAASQQALSPEQVKQVQEIIQSYLIDNPEVLVKASEALQQKMLQRQQKDALTAINANATSIFANPNSPVAGNKDGDTYIVEFFDYQCGHCKAMGPVIKKTLNDNQNVKLIFKELPIFGANSRFAARAALASVKQGKYFAFHNALLGTTDPLTQKKVFEVAKKTGLNLKMLRKDMNSEAIKQQLRQNFELAQKLRIMGTPAFIVAGKTNGEINKIKFIPGAVPQATLQAEINAVK